MWGLLNLFEFSARGSIDASKNAAFNLSGPVAIPGAAFCGKKVTLTFKLLWSVNLDGNQCCGSSKGIISCRVNSK